ncbi:MAG: protein BatD, partial [Chloroflexi bacterium]|nr:protein BatD [Chloroflexota bacterium]
MLTGTVRKTTLIALLLILALAINAGVSHAQVVPVTAHVDKNILSTDEILTLTVTIVGETNVPLPVLPHIDGAQIIGRSTASQITITNGKATAEFNFAFRLQPLREGSLTIGPITVLIGGVKHATDPIEVSIVRGSGQFGAPATPPTPTSRSLAGQDRFISAEVDNETPYLGEQITFTAIYFDANAFGGRRRYRPPDFTGFWKSQDPQQRSYSQNTAGRRYSVTELTSILFPTVVGDLVIDPAVMDVSTRFFGSSRTPIASAATSITVKPLPTGPPASFTGAVGSYEISASVDTNDITSSDSVTLTIILSGQGNLDALPEPAWPDMPGWRIFDNRADTATYISDGKLSGTRTYQRVLIPEITGFLDVPPIEYGYFDPTEERYVVVSTQPMTVTVSLGAEASASNFAGAPAKLDVNRAESDIRHIKTSQSSLDLGSAPLTSRRLYWALWV